MARVGQVAVITGGASGIGLGFAKKCVELGMSVVIADIRENALNDAKASLLSLNGPGKVISCVTDVSKLESMKELSEISFRDLGRVDILFLNAGIAGGSVYEDIERAEWVYGVNQFGVLYGIHCFVPNLIDQVKNKLLDECHVVTTASLAGIAVAQGTYGVTKHAVVALSEALEVEFENKGIHGVKVHTLCPSFVNTPIVENSSQFSRDKFGEFKLTDQEQKVVDDIKQFLNVAMTPDIVAEIIFQALDDGVFYIDTHPKATQVLAEHRMKGIMETKRVNFQNDMMQVLLTAKPKKLRKSKL